MRWFDRSSLEQARTEIIRFVGLRPSRCSRRTARTLFLLAPLFRSPPLRLVRATPLSTSFRTIFGATAGPSRPRAASFLGTPFPATAATTTPRSFATSRATPTATTTAAASVSRTFAMLVALGTFPFFFTPLPGFEGVPIGVVVSAFTSWLATLLSCFLGRFSRRGSFGFDVCLRDDLFFNLEFGLDIFIRYRIVQAQIGSEIIFRRSGDAVFLGLGDAECAWLLTGFWRRGGCRGGLHWLGSGLCRLRAGWKALGIIEGQIFGADERLPRAFRPQINAEEVFGQRFPGILFATSARVRRICIHSRKIPVGRRPCKSLRAALPMS